MSLQERNQAKGARKAAILLSFLGEEAAAPILRNLSPDELQKITREVSTLDRVPLETTLQVLEEYHELMSAQEFTTVGGQDVAVRMLVKAFGDSGAKPMLERMSHPQAADSDALEALKNADPEQLARFLAGEHVQTKALILGYLEPKQASSLLMKLQPEERAECVKRLATMRNTPPAVVSRVSSVLQRKLKPAGDQSKRGDSGVRSLAEMLNRLDAKSAREILDAVEAAEPNLAISIRDLMFTFEDFIGVPEQDLRDLVASVDKKTLMVALKSASEEVRSHIYRTMSSRAVDMMKEDSEVMGPVRSKDVVKAQSEIVAMARKLEAEGKIALKSEGEDEYVA